MRIYSRRRLLCGTVQCGAMWSFIFENATLRFCVVLLQAKSYGEVGFGKTAPNRTAPNETETPSNVLIVWDPRSIASGETDMPTETRTNLNRSSRCQFHEVNDMSPGVGQHYNKLGVEHPHDIIIHSSRTREIPRWKRATLASQRTTKSRVKAFLATVSWWIRPFRRTSPLPG